jgi:hypothetical protein
MIEMWKSVNFIRSWGSDYTQPATMEPVCGKRFWTATNLHREELLRAEEDGEW